MDSCTDVLVQSQKKTLTFFDFFSQLHHIFTNIFQDV